MVDISSPFRNDPVYEDILNSITKLCQAHPEICGDNKDKSSRSITGIYADKYKKYSISFQLKIL